MVTILISVTFCGEHTMSNASPTLAATLQSLVMAVAANTTLDRAKVADVSAVNSNVIHSLDNLSSLEQAASWTLLQLAAMVAPAAIPVLIFTEGGELLGEAWNSLAQDATRARRLLANLAQAGLINQVIDEPSAAVLPTAEVFHLAPQLIPLIRAKMSEAVQRETIKRLITVLEALFPAPNDPASAEGCAPLYPLVPILGAYLKLYNLADETAGNLLNRAGFYAVTVGRVAEAESLYQTALTVRAEVLGKRHTAYASTLNNLADLYAAQMRYPDAVAHYQTALAIIEANLGEEHAWYVTILQNLAELHLAQGEFAAALPLMQQVVRVRQTELGTEHPDYINSQSVLADCYAGQGQYDQALPLMQQTLAAVAQLVGQEHPWYISSLNNLATAYEATTAYSEALNLYQQARAILEQLLPAEHPARQSLQESINRVQGKQSD
jgi:tetratricopeptide (TPR) repeat protein